MNNIFSKYSGVMDSSSFFPGRRPEGRPLGTQTGQGQTPPPQTFQNPLLANLAKSGIGQGILDRFNSTGRKPQQQPGPSSPQPMPQPVLTPGEMLPPPTYGGGFKPPTGEWGMPGGGQPFTMPMPPPPAQPPPQEDMPKTGGGSPIENPQPQPMPQPMPQQPPPMMTQGGGVDDPRWKTIWSGAMNKYGMGGM